MGRIRVLGADVVNKIAAGEVIERPASVVKELVENALDAGATEVRVDIEEGGRRLLRVTDNGSGIVAEDLPLAFNPHATSKLQDADDLFRVGTFGFRGEALASIGSVARARIVSRPPGGEGSEIVADNGEVSDPKPAAAAPGTIVEVRNLFHRVPVRRRFLRSVEVETGHVVDTFARFAIARPEVRFDLHVDGERRHALPPADTRRRIAAFFGEELAESLREIETAHFHGYLGMPKHSRINAKGVNFWLNGRYIRDRVLLRGVNEGYRELVPHGRYPVAFFFFTLPPEDVDVNVHPTKIEVRFRSVWKLHDGVAVAIRKEMLGTDLAPRILPEVLERSRIEEPRGGLAAAGQVVDFFSREPGEVPAPAPGTTVAPPLLTTGRRVFQLHNRYLVEEVDDGLKVMDQHALHERVMLEEFRKQYAAAAIARQKLLIPSTVDLTRAQRALLDDQREMLESFGIEFDDFGRETVAVRAVPALVAEQDPARLLLDFLELAEDKKGDVPLLERALEFMACRAAVKFGKKLADEEIARLLTDAAALDNPTTCAHGRPTSIKLTLDDLEKFFHR